MATKDKPAITPNLPLEVDIAAVSLNDLVLLAIEQPAIFAMLEASFTPEVLAEIQQQSLLDATLPYKELDEMTEHLSAKFKTTIPVAQQVKEDLKAGSKVHRRTCEIRKMAAGLQLLQLVKGERDRITAAKLEAGIPK